MKKILLIYLNNCMFTACLLCSVSSFAQQPDTLSGILEKRQEVFRRMAVESDSFEDSLWFQGRVYEFTLRSKIGTPYYLDQKYLVSNMTFNGKQYNDILLGYNLVTGEVVLRESLRHSGTVEVVLNRDLLKDFDMKYSGIRHSFLVVSDSRPFHEHLPEGIYEVYYEGGLIYLGQHRKTLAFNPSEGVNDSFSYQHDKTTYIIYKGQAHDVSRRKDFLQVFSDHKKSIKKYLRKEKIDYETAENVKLKSLCRFMEDRLFE